MKIIVDDYTKALVPGILSRATGFMLTSMLNDEAVLDIFETAIIQVATIAPMVLVIAKALVS